MKKVEFRVVYDISTDGFAVILTGYNHEGKKIHGEVNEEGRIILKEGKVLPLIRFDIFSIKELATAINNAGIKPDEESKVRGLYEATLKHLDDMRKLVDFYTVGVSVSDKRIHNEIKVIV